MNVKAVFVATLFISGFSFSALTVAEKMIESPKHKGERIETILNVMLVAALKAAVQKLDKNNKMSPFAIVQKKDGSIGFFTVTADEKKKAVDQQAATVRTMLVNLANTRQINASVQVMYRSIVNGKANKGLVFEVEHREGVSLVQLIPVAELKNDAGKKTGKLSVEMEGLSTSSKPKIVFATATVH